MVSSDVLKASNGQQSSQLLVAVRCNLIISGLAMPVTDGIALAETAEKMPNCKFAPVVMPSSEKDEAKVAEAIRIGFSGFLRKPVKGLQLKPILKNVLGS